MQVASIPSEEKKKLISKIGDWPCMNPKLHGTGGGMEKSIRKYTNLANLDEVKADEYRYWQSRALSLIQLGTAGSRKS